MTQPTVRRNCAFCHYERSPKDNNHGPSCSYWDFFGPCECGYPFDRPEHTIECATSGGTGIPNDARDLT